MNISELSTKDTGNIGERVACEYLEKYGFTIEKRNVRYKTGEIDIISKKAGVLHLVEVKSVLCDEFTKDDRPQEDDFDPSVNIHEAKIRKIARTGEWYVAHNRWEGEWQIDAVLVWLRRRDGTAKVRYLPQIV